ncbi:hypothetical protein DUI87_28058 [Hirundo rustica rustica]|uniref:Uncharacterized protein n=1 Tax=Hirundo rustica rustica TaxID=333673 RepID=A0A3M0JKT7_HIRRU|nr:hypothetical protein DUI87_28058 [Hirundo rustica rustica]
MDPEGPGQAAEVGLSKPGAAGEGQIRVLDLGQGSPQHRLGREGTESSPEVRDLGMLVHEELNRTQPRVLDPQTPSRPGLHQRSVASRSERWPRVPRAAVADPGSLKVSKARLDGAWSSLGQWKVSLPVAGGGMN